MKQMSYSCLYLFHYQQNSCHGNSALGTFFPAIVFDSHQKVTKILAVVNFYCFEKGGLLKTYKDKSEQHIIFNIKIYRLSVKKKYYNLFI
ncbi:hypothetical protein KUTeg_020536 [Tegillarca granosa]|uniref:Uncharacterized protein n=1 Tax=Tegillarca granosa TaxID=220873 RepID=A0ABQ9E862_TEGGR|nr:hypothetical protein KUTeg_020536 [Tegillarca granosa]